MQKIDIIKKLIINAEWSLLNGKLDKAQRINNKARKMFSDSFIDKNTEDLNNKLIRQQNEITILMVKVISNSK